MKTLIITISIILSVIVILSSCAKKYDGCCTYTINYTGSYNIGTPAKQINDCFTQQSKAIADGKKADYNNARQQAINSSGQPYQIDITGPGCNY